MYKNKSINVGRTNNKYNLIRLNSEFFGVQPVIQENSRLKKFNLRIKFKLASLKKWIKHGFETKKSVL